MQVAVARQVPPERARGELRDSAGARYVARRMSAVQRPPPAGSSPAEEKKPAPAPYEFGDEDKDRFRALAASVSFVGVCTMLFGGLAILFFAGALYAGFVPHALVTAAVAIVCLVTAWWMVSAGRSLSALVRTRGRDIEDLMEAVVQFRRLFGLARVVIVVIALLAVAGCVLFVWCNLLVEHSSKCPGPWS
jgi:hypothetical protein